MIRVYIAMPYGDHNSLEQRQRNTDAAMRVWHLLADAGFAPFCPHLSHFLHEFSNRERMHWLSQTAAWIEPCDCVLALGESEGVDDEVSRAFSMGKPVFRIISDLGDAYGMDI